MAAFSGIGPALSLLRRKRGLSGTQMLEKLGGVARSTLTRLEHKDANPEAGSIDRYLDVIGATAQDLADAIDEVNGRAKPPAAGTPRPDWVSALTRAGLDAEILQAFALGALSFATPRAEADFVESARAVATDLARAAVENARATYQPKPSD